MRPNVGSFYYTTTVYYTTKFRWLPVDSMSFENTPPRCTHELARALMPYHVQPCMLLENSWDHIPTIRQLVLK